jgi:hypothetical protein
MNSRSIQIAVASFLLSISASAAGLSSYADVKQVLLDEAVPMVSDLVSQELQVYQQGRLPHYQMSMRSVFEFGSAGLEKAANRTINDKSDYLNRLPKLLHPNGVCVMGKWHITKDSPYSGAFAANTENLFVGRISVAMQETTSDSGRGFGFAGKLFPTLNENEPVATENLFTVDVLMGTNTKRFLDTATTNEPELGFDIWLVRLGLKIASALTKADENPGFRPVKNLAMMGIDNGVTPKFPHWIRLSTSKDMQRNNQPDFRAEVVQAVDENKELIFYIDGSDTTKDRSKNSGWKRLGEIRVNQAVVSYGCDRRLHFSHPKLK